jgi:transmembrane sensor
MIHDTEGPRLARYLAGECSPEEADEVRAWISADPAREEMVESLRQVWEATGRLPAGWDVNGAWDQLVAARVARQVRPLRPEPATAPARGFALSAGWSIVRIAAALVLAVGGAGVLWRVAFNHTPARLAPAANRIYTTARGERGETRLADGTRVLLGPDSKLVVPVGYGTGARAVQLEGEAYFEVVHDSARPFAVHARNAVARDLGTRFGVRAYAEDPQVQVVVAEGRVSLGAVRAVGDSDAVLTRGELGRLDAGGTALVVRGVDLDRYLGWTEGQLVFRGAPLSEAAAEIGRWRDIEIRLASPELGEKRLNASFNDESAGDVVRTVATALDLRVTQQGRVYTLTPK